MSDELIGIDVESVTKWFEDHLPGTKGPLDFDLIAGGLSNLTYKVTPASGGVYILRRPPIKPLSKSAHDVRREYRMMLALAGTRVPVPPVAGFCPDEGVTGAHFYVTKFVEGTPLHDKKSAEQFLDEDGRRNAAYQLVDTMAELHSVDPDAVGLGELGKRDGYIERQIKAWFKDYHPPLIADVRDELAARIPDQGPPALVHADFRLGNCLFDERGEVQAVLDWETCTLGDPLADIAYNLVWWPEPGEPRLLPELPSDLPGFPTREELLKRYGEKSGRDLSRFGFHLAFQFWRMACIAAYGEVKEAASAGDGMVESFALRARELLRQLD